MVIDTMVFIYALLGNLKFREQALAVLEKTNEIIVPDSIRYEMVNVVWQWINWGNLAYEKGIEILCDVEGLFTEVIASNEIWFEALNLSLKNQHSAYDTLFIALAQKRRTKLITYDKKLLNTFPDYVVNVKNYLKTR